MYELKLTRAQFEILINVFNEGTKKIINEQGIAAIRPINDLLAILEAVEEPKAE